MSDCITYVGLDVHKSPMAVAMYLPGKEKPVEWQQQNTVASLRRLTRRLETRSAGQVLCCYEAGPCGYSVRRTLARYGIGRVGSGAGPRAGL